jgi:hypothetical protein
MTSSSPNDDCYAKARQLIDQVHAQDPASVRAHLSQAASGTNLELIAFPFPLSLLDTFPSGSYYPCNGVVERLWTERLWVRQLEMGYADDMERWVVALDPEAEEDQVLRLAARCQHLNRVRLYYPLTFVSYKRK